MKISASAVSLNVDDVAASVRFLTTHFGFTETMSADGFASLARLQAEGVPITMPLRSDAWGERAFQVRDPNGVIVELLDWNAPAG